MHNYQTIKIAPDFQIQVLPHSRGFDLSDHEKLLVENIWSHEPNALFNGEILNFISLEGGLLTGEFVEYKYFLASLRDKELQEKLEIKPVSLTGITIAGEKILMGQRSATVTQYPNKYELVPSGGINSASMKENTVDITRQFELELWEESGISVTEIKHIRPFACVYDSEKLSYEVCAEIAINYTATSEEPEPSEEYQKLEWVTRTEISRFVKKNNESFVPTSIHLLNICKILKEF